MNLGSHQAPADDTAFRPRPQSDAVPKLRALGLKVEALDDGAFRIVGDGWAVTTRRAWNVLGRLTADVATDGD